MATAFVAPVVLESRNIRVVPLGFEHEDGIRAAASDGRLWELRVTSVPELQEVRAYITTALQTDNRFAFAVLPPATTTYCQRLND